MNEQSQNQLRHHWLGWIAMLAFASVLSPINIHILIAQELPPIVVAPADPGAPPTPTEAPAAPVIATDSPDAASTEPVSPTAEPTTIETVAEPVAELAPVQEPDVPATPSEVSSDSDIGKLLPTESTRPESITNESTIKTSETTPSPKSDSETVRTLSVEPGLRAMLPDDRPAWVGALPDFSSSQHFLYVGSLPTRSQAEADAALDAPLVAAVRSYIDQEVIKELGASNSMPVTPEFIRRNLIDNPAGYECELLTGQEPSFQKWVTVRITPEQRDLFRKWKVEATQRTRLAPLGAGLIAILSVISLSHVVLRRFCGATPLTMVNQHVAEQVVRKTRSGSSFRWLFFVFLIFAVAFAFLLPLFAIRAVRIESSPAATIVDGPTLHGQFVHPTIRDFPALHNELRIETLDGEQRTIILESKSHR